MPDQAANREGGFISHLIELRNRLMYSLLAVLVVFIPLAIFSDQLYALVAMPLLAELPGGTSMVAIDVPALFLIPIKLALIVAIVISIPFLLYQLWAFVAPGLYRHEQRLIFPLLFSSTVLFYCGMAFAYFVVFPLAFHFFINSAPAGVQAMPDIKSYLDFVFAMFLAFGVAFEVPVAIVLLVRAGVVRADTLAQKRPYMVLWTFVLAMLLTPPDVISQTLLAIPMLLLFEVGLFFARRITPKEDNSDNDIADKTMDQEMEKFERDIGGGE